VSTPSVDEPGARQRILDAAIAEFAQYGFAGARINRIADSARANKQLIYRYFGNKDDLYAAVMSTLVRRTRGEFAVHGLANLFRPGEFVKAHGAAWARMLAWEGLNPPTHLIAAEERQASIQRQLDSIVELQRKGEIDSGLDARFVLATVYAVRTIPMIMPQLMEFCFGPELAGSDELIHLWSDFLEGLLAPADETAAAR